jgi:hypothetical protein
VSEFVGKFVFKIMVETHVFEGQSLLVGCINTLNATATLEVTRR